jgi:hypothetical protein
MDVIARFCSDPFVALIVLHQSLYLTRDNEKILCIGVRARRNRDTWWDCAPEHAEVALCVLGRTCQKFYSWSEKFEDFAGARILLKAHVILSFLDLQAIIIIKPISISI